MKIDTSNYYQSLLNVLKFLRARIYFFISLGIIMLVYCWMITYGTWNILDQENFGTFYDAQAKSFLEGRLDIPLSAIRGEAFIRDGKYYGYFGFGPALLRLPFVLIFPHSEGIWTRSLMVVACILTIVYAYLICDLICTSY